jgi:hypothetical protein
MNLFVHDCCEMEGEKSEIFVTSQEGSRRPLLG